MGATHRCIAALGSTLPAAQLRFGMAPSNFGGTVAAFREPFALGWVAMALGDIRFAGV
ncbi:MAG: hypothetical protein IPN62_00025 [Flavobacteriales bacterium]|nr:hypothetical protein [Flavobacteriales bacterium]